MSLTVERVVYKDKYRTPQEWLGILGYDLEYAREYAHKNKMKLTEVTRALVLNAYEGKPLPKEMSTFRDRKHPKDLTNMHFGKLKVISHVEGKMWKCKCECGETTVVERRFLLCGDVSSCGCGMRENQNYFRLVKAKGMDAECMKLTYKDRTLTVTEWSRQPEQIELGIKRKNIYNRIRRGWTVERTLTERCHTLKE